MKQTLTTTSPLLWAAIAGLLSSSALVFPQTLTSTLWFADMETASTSQWLANGGGSVNSTGNSSAAVSRQQAHGGSYSLKLTTTTPPEGGTAATRWLEVQSRPNLSYGAWYYFPQVYTVRNYWNVMQWGSRNPSNGAIDPFFTLNVGNRNGSMYLYLFNWQTHTSYSQAVKNIPVGRWTNIQGYYGCAGDGTGHITIWEDGTQLVDIAGVQTRYANGDCRWAINSLSDNVSPAGGTFFVDDAVIGTSGTVAPPLISQMSITTASLPSATVGTPYSATLSAIGGTSPYTWSMMSGSLPPGLALNSGGSISGTPLGAGAYAVALRVRDSAAVLQTVTSGAVSLNVSTAPVGNVVWSADTETGTKSQWYYPATSANGNEGGGEFNSGISGVSASQDVAHSGRYSLKHTITTPPESGTRMFRWLETRQYRDLTYSNWFYIPQRYSIANWWMLEGWKSRLPSGQTDPFFGVNVGNRGDGSMYLYVFNPQTRLSYSQTLKNVPVGQWFNVTARYTCAGDNTGHLTLWQDGAQLIDIANVQTRYSNGDCQFELTDYSDGVSPSPTVIYTDDSQLIVK
ncbi:MAG: hypothetical protein JWN34_268 [Bryobacterales bacterium]|nr:hypothetical protein [Bryobacterales bacterium]